MSAFICSPLHINTIVTWAAQHSVGLYLSSPNPHWRYAAENDNAQFFAALLYSENVRSVNYRYSERTKRAGLIYTPAPLEGITPVQIIKLGHCLGYQSCEHPQWERSKAKRFLQHVIDAATMRLPGYDQAKWSI